MRKRMNIETCLRAMAALVTVILLGASAHGQAPSGYTYTQAPSAPVYTYAAQPTAAPTYTYAAQPAEANQVAATDCEICARAAANGAGGAGSSFLSWLNGVRAQYGLPAVGYDANLEGWAAQNSAAQASQGLGHFVMGPARRQNSAMGSLATIGSQWLASPAHRAALLDPTIRAIGLAGYGAYWTFNAY